MPLTTQMGWKKEVSYGSAMVVDRFQEFESESITPDMRRIEPTILRAATRGMREDRFIPYVAGYAGSIAFPVMSKQFGGWLEHMIGGTTATGALTDSSYTHTATLAGTTSLSGKGFTLQMNRPLGESGTTDQAFTYAGGKIASWTLSCEQGDIVKFEADVLFASGTTATALAVASYPTGLEFLPFGLSQVTVAGLSVPVTSWSVQCDNALKDDRFYIRNSYDRKEPIENGYREITVSFTMDFEAITDGTPAGKLGVYNRVIATIPANSLASVVIATTAPTLIGATTYPALTITMDKVRIDEGAPTVDGPEQTMIDVTGKALVPASGTWLSVAYRSTESTP